MSADLAQRICAGERAAVAQALNLLDARDSQTRAQGIPLLRALKRRDRRDARRIGLTGAPGAGKSTLVDALIGHLRARGHTVGIIAVDPSSQASGGALLGDRVRAQRAAGDRDVFFRSMAARGRLGGISAATRAGVSVMAAAYDWLIVETVGVGQSELEVADLVDTLVYVAQPGAGDILQYMKAGLLELPDVFAVNKADLGVPADRTAQELRRGLVIGTSNDTGPKPPVLKVSASEGEGIEALLDAIEAHRAALGAGGRSARYRAGDERFVATELAQRYGDYGLRALGGADALRAICDQRPDEPAHAIVEEAAGLIERRLSVAG